MEEVTIGDAMNGAIADEMLPHVHHPRQGPAGIVWYFFVTGVHCRRVALLGMVRVG